MKIKNVLISAVLSLNLMIIISGFRLPEQNRQDTLKVVRIPLAGNAYLTDGVNTGQITNKGVENWYDQGDAYSVYFKLEKGANVEVGVRGRVEDSPGTIQLISSGKNKNIQVSSTSFEEYWADAFKLSKGYNRIDISGITKSGSTFPQLTDLLLKVDDEQDVIYVADNKANHYYWGRRGPSVHLNYKLPSDIDAEWLYSELNVPAKMDPVGSYFMANGFGEGYFGMQVNGPKERRVLFSVWSPYDTNDPSEIPESKRIELLKKGEDVHTGKFGNEGSGGQSYWKYSWQTGQTYRFLTQIKPDNQGNTIYTSYFYAPERGSWKLIARFRRPQTDTWMSNPHSFLENFSARNGYKTRKALYGNQWVRDKQGSWHELTKAKFTGDNIASIGFREDFKSGTAEKTFYLQNGGFFDANIPINTQLERTRISQPPKIDFDSLP